jgi:hypothetical protein
MTNETVAIAEFLRTRGATRCPTAFAAPSASAALSPEDIARLRQHHARQEAAAAAAAAAANGPLPPAAQQGAAGADAATLALQALVAAMTQQHLDAQALLPFRLQFVCRPS